MRLAWSPPLVAIALLAVASAVAGRDVPVRIDGCPSELILTVPDEFTQALTTDQLSSRTELLEILHRNPARKARYADVLVVNWASPSRLPHVLIGSLGATQKAQGSYTQSHWQDLKRNAIASSKAQQEEWARLGVQRLKRGMSGSVEQIQAKVREVGEGGPNDFTLFGESTATLTTGTASYLSAAKLNYARRCIAHVTIAIDAQDPEGLAKLVRITQGVSVR